MAASETETTSRRKRPGDDRVAAVVATRNRCDQLLATLARLTTIPEAPKVVVVDNASDDGTAAAVRRSFPAVDVIALPENAGACARTVGVRHVDAPYVAFNDDDSWWAPGSLTLAADVLDAAPQLALVAGRVVVDHRGQIDPVTAAQESSPLPRNDDVPGIPVLGFLACGAVVRRSAYLQVGGFDDLLHFLGEEEQLALDLAEAGWALSYVAEIIVHHEPGPRTADNLAFRRQRVARNRLLLAWMRRPARVAARRTLSAALDALDDRAARGALLEAARRLPAAWRRRRVISPAVERQMRLLERGSER